MRILRLAEGRDRGREQLLTDEVELLSWSMEIASPPDEVSDFLLRVLEGDICESCQGRALDLSLVQKYGRDRMVPIFMSVLDRALSTPIAGGVEARGGFAAIAIRNIAIWGGYPESLPYLIKALDLDDVSIRVHAITGLERVTGLGRKELGYEQEARRYFGIDIPGFVSADLQALESVVSKWKDWWRINGKTFLRERGIGAQAATGSESSL